MIGRWKLAAVLGAAIALASALVAASELGSREPKVSPAPSSSTAPVRTFAGVPQRGPVLGAPSAPVTLVEYADLQCPYCAEWDRSTLPVLVSDYVRAGKLRVVFRGLAFIGPDSATALRTAIAAGRQNRLWDVVDTLYRKQGAENSGWVSDDLLAGVAGLDVERLRSERAHPAVDREIAFAAAAAREAGVPGTPAFQVGRTGGKLELVQLASLGPEALRPAIEAALTG